MHPALERIREITRGTGYENRLWIVGGAVRDELLGIPHTEDFDLVLEDSAPKLAEWLFQQGLSGNPPVIYARFGTAMLRIKGAAIEMVTARRESYDTESRKPDVEPATLLEDAERRDFTINALLRNIHTGELFDPLRTGLEDLKNRILRTPLEPAATFHDDPLRMLRAVRFRWKLGFEPAPGLYESIRETRERLGIISAERIRDELLKMLALPDADRCFRDLFDLGLLEIFAPEMTAMAGVEQGNYHHLDVWEHSLLVLRNAGTGDPILSLSALLHDVGKPPTRFIDNEGRTRFFGHEEVGAQLTSQILGRLRFSQKEIEAVALLVKNHMRLGSSPELSPAAARRLMRDLGDQLPRLLDLVEADADGLKQGVRRLDLAPIRERLEQVSAQTPVEKLESPLSGQEIMQITGLEPGPEIGKIKDALLEKVLAGELEPSDLETARRFVREQFGS